MQMRASGDPSLGEGVSCDEEGCVVPMTDGELVARSMRSQALADDCDRAALIVSDRQSPRNCGAAVIDQARLRRQGALALWRKGREFEIEAVRPRGLDRPWSPAAEGEGDTDGATISRPIAPRATDATPSETDLQPDD